MKSLCKKKFIHTFWMIYYEDYKSKLPKEVRNETLSLVTVD